MTNLLPTLDPGAAFWLVQQGGPVVVIIGLFSVVALAVVIAKLAQFLWLGIGSASNGLERALAMWTAGDISSARNQLEGYRNPTARIVRHGMDALAMRRDEASVREDVERVAMRSLADLRRYLRVIEATAQVTPLLGLFGTVIGMMSAFQGLQSAGAASDPAALAGGIWVALITTAVGLAVAMPASVVLFWFEGRIDREKANMEDAVTRMFTERPALLRPDASHRTGYEGSAAYAAAAE